MADFTIGQFGHESFMWGMKQTEYLAQCTRQEKNARKGGMEETEMGDVGRNICQAVDLRHWKLLGEKERVDWMGGQVREAFRAAGQRAKSLKSHGEHDGSDKHGERQCMRVQRECVDIMAKHVRTYAWGVMMLCTRVMVFRGGGGGEQALCPLIAVTPSISMAMTVCRRRPKT